MNKLIGISVWSFWLGFSVSLFGISIWSWKYWVILVLVVILFVWCLSEDE